MIPSKQDSGGIHNETCLHQLDELIVQPFAAHVVPADNCLAQCSEAASRTLQGENHKLWDMATVQEEAQHLCSWEPAAAAVATAPVG